MKNHLPLFFVLWSGKGQVKLKGGQPCIKHWSEPHGTVTNEQLHKPMPHFLFRFWLHLFLFILLLFILKRKSESLTSVYLN